MESLKPAFEKYVFVCENQRREGACCGRQGESIREKLKTRIRELGLAGKIRVSRSGCLDVCAEGPNVLLMPDNVWFKRVGDTDIDDLITLAKGTGCG